MKRLFLWLSNYLLLIWTACGQNYENFDALLKDLYKNSVPLITPAKLHTELAQDSQLIIIDAREKREYDVSHLNNARYGGYDEFDIDQCSDIPRDARIVVYCSVGYRSERIGEKLQKAGFKNVRNLYGGIFEWKNEGFPVYHENKETEKVHAYSPKWGKWLNKGDKVYD